MAELPVFPPPGLDWPAPPGAPPAPELPPIAAKANDLEAIRKAVDDAAAVSGGLWLSYLFVLFYFAIAAGAVTHADLFFENPVKLPFLGVDLPLLAFFFLAPILFVFIHAYILAHLVLLADKAKRFDSALRDQISHENADVRDSLRRQLPSNIFIQFLAGPADVRGSAFGWLLRTIAWVTLVIAPVLLLLMMQIQFLPFHNSFITWTHRLALLVDLGFLWWLWRRIVSGREIGGRRWTSWPRIALGLALSFLLSLGVVAFSWATATFPGERQEELLARWDKTRSMVSLHDRVFNSTVDPISGRRWLPFSSTLVLPGLNVLERLNIDDPKKVEWRQFVFLARGRDLRGATLASASLPKVDFIGANLENASLDGAQLNRAAFDSALLEGASFNGAQLEGASFSGAQLQGASLRNAQLPGVSLYDARLQGASLAGAQLQGASLAGAQLQGASLDGAELDGATMTSAQLQGASLIGTRLHGASLDGAQLQGVSLTGAHLNDDTLKADGVDDAAHAIALAAELKKLACSGDRDAAYVVRGYGFLERLYAAGAEAPALIAFIMSKDCPVSASLTDADKAKLLGTKRDAIKKPGG